MKKSVFVNLLVTIIVAIVLTLISGLIYLYSFKNIDPYVVVSGVFIISLISLWIGSMIHNKKEDEELEIEIKEQSELEYYLEVLATIVLRANNVEFQDVEQESDSPTYFGYYENIKNDKTQILATIKIAGPDKILTIYHLCFVGEEYSNAAWFIKE